MAANSVGWICRCGTPGALIETHAPGYGRHRWHLSCLQNWREFTAGSRPAPTRYIWEPAFDFETPLVKGRNGDDSE